MSRSEARSAGSLEPEAASDRARTERSARTQKIQIEQHGLAGLLWFGGWLFTIGFLHLPFWKAVLALVVWPYYVGTSFSPPLP